MQEALSVWGAQLRQADFPGEALLTNAYASNGWFTSTEIKRAIAAIAEMLEPGTMEKWLKPYTFPVAVPKTIAVILAGNIPLVGFHDILCVLVSGHRAMVKMSSADAVLLPAVLDLLENADPALRKRILLVEGKMTGFDAVIATGSNNSARYFEYYFGKYPHLFRRNRTSVAVLDGNESGRDLAALGNDIFSYYGLGCRNVTKLYIPEEYDLNRFFEAMYPFRDVLLNKKYGNNYDYYRALYLMNSSSILDNNFLLLKEDAGLHSPPAVLYYERYRNIASLEDKLRMLEESIQCIVGSVNVLGRNIPFGSAQRPAPWNYADGEDTLRFLAAV
ncbi:MAG: acyl-CoA reductase [Bacteroidia bacterium]|nr:acyl-CoA reductase [Bacteroidia bacterium]